METKFKTKCPRCDGEAEVTKTSTHLITRCVKCGFDMGQVREAKN